MRWADETKVLEALRPVIDPELGLSIVDLGLVTRIEVSPHGAVHVAYTTTAPACPLASFIGSGILQALARLPDVASATAELSAEPWDPSRMSLAAREQLAGAER